MIIDRYAALRKVRDLRNLLDASHKKGFCTKSRMEGLALSLVTRVLREKKAYRGDLIFPKALLDSMDSDLGTIAYLKRVESINREVMSRNDRMAFYCVRSILEDVYYVGWDPESWK